MCISNLRIAMIAPCKNIIFKVSVNGASNSFWKKCVSIVVWWPLIGWFNPLCG